MNIAQAARGSVGLPVRGPPALQIIILIIVVRFIKCLRPWLQRRWRQVSRGCYSKALRKKYVLSLDLNRDSESALIIVSGNEFQTAGAGAEQRKARLAKSVLVNGLSSSGTADER